MHAVVEALVARHRRCVSGEACEGHLQKIRPDSGQSVQIEACMLDFPKLEPRCYEMPLSLHGQQQGQQKREQQRQRAQLTCGGGGGLTISW